jgi:hypothetical protein
VKTSTQESLEIVLEIPDAAFTRASGISIQDAAPMAYEKLVELLSEDAFDTSKLCLTDADVARYIDRHLTSQKRTYSFYDRRPPSASAA